MREFLQKQPQKDNSISVARFGKEKTNQEQTSDHIVRTAVSSRFNHDFTRIPVHGSAPTIIQRKPANTTESKNINRDSGEISASGNGQNAVLQRATDNKESVDTANKTECWEPQMTANSEDVHGACVKADGMSLCMGSKATDVSKSAAAPNDPLSLAQNATVNGVVDSFNAWSDYEYGLIIVPGFTPLDATKVIRMDPEEKVRVKRAEKDFNEHKAPFIFVSGGAVYPGGTPCYESVEMKHELMGSVPENRIIVDAAAQHSTTNIRNAGRYMLQHNIPNSRALITTSGSQDFYFSHPLMSSFHHRSKKELGYRIGNLKDEKGAGHSVYTPSEKVNKPGRDPQDR